MRKTIVMSGYSDNYKDQQQDEFISKWVPEQRTGDPIPEDRFFYVLARARSAEMELKDLKRRIREVSELVEMAKR